MVNLHFSFILWLSTFYTLIIKPFPYTFPKFIIKFRTIRLKWYTTFPARMILTQLIFFLTGSWTIFTAPWASPLSNYIRRYFKLFSTFYTFSFNFLFERWAIFSTKPIFSIFRLTNLTAINPSLNLTIYYRLCFLKLFSAKSTNSFNFLTIKTLFAAIFSRTLLNSRRNNFEFSSTSFTNSFLFCLYKRGCSHH